jgi:uncharacterized protein (TIGR02646 family)
MIKLRSDIVPSPETLLKLKEYQDEINRLPTFAQKSARAKVSFSSKNTKSNTTFHNVKESLTEMCNSTRRCVYCEDSLGDEVEHIFPKDLYPERCFDWNNYVYACGPCNGPKNNKFAVHQHSNGALTVVNPPKGTSTSQPPAGDPVMINPRTEDPLQFAILDLAGTFEFIALPGITAKEKQRSDYTFNEVLRLNHADREPLRQGRENAYSNYSSRLFEYVMKKRRIIPPYGKRCNGIMNEIYFRK